MVDEVRFEELVVEEIEALPPEFAVHLENVDIFVLPRPSPAQRRAAGIRPWQQLYGLYEGIPHTRRTAGYNLVMPDTITIFSEPMLDDFRSEAALREQIRRTIKHEIAHHFGTDDDRLRELGAY